MSAAGWSDPGFAEVVRKVGERTGLVFTPNLRQSVEDRIRGAMADQSIRGFDLYLSALDRDPTVFAALAASLTIGETYFFREPGQFEYLRNTVVPQLLRDRGPGASLRAWSAGCAAGEEAYSLAIMFRELGLSGSAEVIGTDLSEERLARAREGAYSSWSLRGVPEAVQRRHFTRKGRSYRVAPEIRASVRFERLNLADAFYPASALGIGSLDLILCRNVLIYLDRATVAAVANRLMNSLGENGWLFLGASDPLLLDIVQAEVVVTGAGIAYRRQTRRRSPIPAASLAPALQPTAARQPVPPAPAVPRLSEPVANDPAADAVHAALRYTARDYSGCVESASRSVAASGDDPAVWVLLVRSLANQGRTDEARRSCLAGIGRHPTCAELLYLDALLLAAAERHADAATAARRALYLDRSLVMAHLLLGDMLRRLGEHQAARRAIRNAQNVLTALPPDTIVPAADGERAERLLRVADLKLKQLEDAA